MIELQWTSRFPDFRFGYRSMVNSDKAREGARPPDRAPYYLSERFKRRRTAVLRDQRATDTLKQPFRQTIWPSIMRLRRVPKHTGKCLLLPAFG